MKRKMDGNNELITASAIVIEYEGEGGGSATGTGNNDQEQEDGTPEPNGECKLASSIEGEGEWVRKCDATFEAGEDGEGSAADSYEEECVICLEVLSSEP